jgi:hypothetical protein
MKWATRVLVVSMLLIVCSSWSRNTNYNDNGLGDVVFLDRHKVDCNQGELLQGWQLQNSGGNYRIAYDCLASKSVIYDSTDNYDEYTTYTNASDDKSLSSRQYSGAKFALHKVKCKDGYGVKKWWLETGGTSCYFGIICTMRLGFTCQRVKLTGGCNYNTSSTGSWSSQPQNMANSQINISGFNIMQGFQLKISGSTFYFDYWYCPVRNFDAEVTAYNNAVNNDVDYTPSWSS